jgi:hypothetical protein
LPDKVVIADTFVEPGLVVPVKNQSLDAVRVIKIFVIASFKANVLPDQLYSYHPDGKS